MMETYISGTHLGTFATKMEAMDFCNYHSNCNGFYDHDCNGAKGFIAVSGELKPTTYSCAWVMKSNFEIIINIKRDIQ